MERTPVRDNPAFLYCREETKDKIRRLKQGGETFDERIRKLARGFDPDAEAAASPEEVDGDGS
ncbi:MAG: hypothetical protein ABEI27_13780 [Halobellus sp.]|uniref:hypothetical protein n=1 Tax=Halobellus sp. TaxID=1979212 RepID=UPI0035D3E2C1